MTEEKLNLLWASCDTNAKGEISYTEFVNAFARDTAEIMLAPTGADPQPTPLEQKRAKVLQTVEDKLDGRYVNLRKARLHPNPTSTRDRPSSTQCFFGDCALVMPLRMGSYGRQAFQAVDIDRSSTVNRKELEQALRMMDMKLSSEDSTCTGATFARPCGFSLPWAQIQVAPRAAPRGTDGARTRLRIAPSRSGDPVGGL